MRVGQPGTPATTTARHLPESRLLHMLRPLVIEAPVVCAQKWPPCRTFWIQPSVPHGNATCCTLSWRPTF
eukprot:1293723-Lingulodinium_polyedra.AAC.1